MAPSPNFAGHTVAGKLAFAPPPPTRASSAGAAYEIANATIKIAAIPRSRSSNRLREFRKNEFVFMVSRPTLPTELRAYVFQKVGQVQQPIIRIKAGMKEVSGARCRHV